MVLQKISTKLKDKVAMRLKKHKNLKLAATNGWSKEETNKNLAKILDLLGRLNEKPKSKYLSNSSVNQKKNKYIDINTMSNDLLKTVQKLVTKKNLDSPQSTMSKSTKNTNLNIEDMLSQLISPYQTNIDHKKSDQFFKNKNHCYDTPPKISILKNEKNDISEFQSCPSKEKTIKKESTQNSTCLHTEFEYSAENPSASKFFGKNDSRGVQYLSTNEKNIKKESSQNSTVSDTEFIYGPQSPCTSNFFEMKLEENDSDYETYQSTESKELNIKGECYDGNQLIR